MASPDSTLQNQFALVSSLYGPGTIICWYLTSLSVLLSWTLHPRKRKSGSIDVDIIAVLTLPAIAAGHLVSQVRRLLNQDSNAQTDSSADWEYLQSVAAIEAPFNVTETFMAISVILFLVAAWMLCIRRAIFVALIGLFCFTVECYVHFSNLKNLGLRYEPGASAGNHPTFSRLFVADFAGLVIAILVTLSVCSLISAAIAFFMLARLRAPSSRSRQDIERVNEAASTERMPSRFGTPEVGITRSAEMTNETRLLGRSQESFFFPFTMVTTIFLPLSFLSTLVPLFWEYFAVTSTAMSFWQMLDQYTSRLVRNLFPRTACSITDLDQVVAGATGATVLGFSIYSVAKAYYKKWTVRRTPHSGSTGTELGRIETGPAS